MSAELLTDTCAVARPIGIRILSGASFLIAAYLFGSGILILLGAIPLASGRYFLGEYVNWGPALYFLVATGFAVLGVGLMRGWRSMRRLAIIAAALLVATSLLPISAAVTYFQIAPLVLHGVKIVLAIMAIRYLLQLPIRSTRMMPELAIMSSSAKPAQPATGAGADWPQYIEEFRRAAHESVDWIADYLSNTRDYPVVAPVNPGQLVDALPKSGPQRGESFEAILKDFREKVIPAVTHWNHPGFMAFFACTGSTPAIIGEMLAAALNTNGLHWKTSPALVELEQVALGWFRDWMGLPRDWFGMVFDTASTGSMHALAAAREYVAPEARENGNPLGLVMYTSEQAHSSIEKGAIAIGIGQKNVRKVPVDAEFRMSASALRELVQRDVAAGLRPFCVVATVGTTSTTSVDPVSAIADVAEQHGMWLHVDCAYAGSAAIVPEFQWILEGAWRADSLVVNPHKWLLTPIDLSCFYTKRPEILRRAFSLVPAYLQNQEDPRAVNLMDYGVPLGHRFRALKFWFVLRYFGRERLSEILRTHIQWAQDLAELIEQDSRFEIAAPHPFSTVCFRLKGSDEQNLAILDRVNASGKFYISQTKLHGRTVLRVAIGNLGTSWDDVRACWEMIRDEQ